MPSATYRAMRAYQRLRMMRARVRRRAARWQGVRILGYHRVAVAPESLSVAPERFRAQMEMVAASGASCVRLDAALPLLERPVEGRHVCVTFDDGYRDNLEQGEPILRELGIPATIFIPSAIIDGEATYHWYEDPPAAMSWTDVSGLGENGLIDVQGHSRTHVRLAGVDESRAWEEIAGCKRDIERHVPYRLTSFAYPAGLYAGRDGRMVARAGFRAGVTMDPGVNPGGEPLWRLRRTMVYWEDADRDFECKLGGLLDRPPLPRSLYYRRLARSAARTGGYASP